MPQLVSLGAVLSCSFGTVPMPMIVTPETPVFEDALPAATIMDFIPLENIPSFGLCTSSRQSRSGGGDRGGGRRADADAVRPRHHLALVPRRADRTDGGVSGFVHRLDVHVRLARRDYDRRARPANRLNRRLSSRISPRSLLRKLCGVPP